MTDTLVTHKTAAMAESVGCPVQLYGYGYEYTSEDGVESWTNTEGGISGTEKTTPVIMCTQSLLQKWLREFPGDWCILVYVVPYISSEPIHQQCHIWCRGELITHPPKETYEEALELGLQAALNMISPHQ